MNGSTGPGRRDFIKLGILAAAAMALPGCSAGDPQPSLTTGRPSSPSPSGPLTDAEQAGSLVLALAQLAAADGSYGIAGTMIENGSGRVVQSIPNQVVKPLNPGAATDPGETFTYDPTAHGERQLVSWYFEHRKELSLPPPEQLSIVTSLDPCAMCTGALLTAGFNTGVVAMDRFSGINFDGSGEFHVLPAPLRQEAVKRFGYYAVEGGRAYDGGRDVVFGDTTLRQATYDGCAQIYQSSAKGVRETRHNTGTDPKQLEDPATGAAAAPVRDAFAAAYPDAFTLKLKNFRKPDVRLERQLRDLVHATPGARNAAAFIDPFGNLIAAFADTFDVSPVQTAFMNVTQAYAKTRFALVDDPATSAIARKTLTSPKFGTFVWLKALSPHEPTTIEDLGAFGSTMESAAPQPDPSPFQYYLPPDTGTVAELQRVINQLPPLYSKLVKIDPQLVGG